VAERIQLRRTKGWRKPPGAVVVSRPSKWGNPCKLDHYDIRDEHGRPAARAVQLREARALATRDFWAMLYLDNGELPFTQADVVRELRGKDLACWCPLDQECHADVLLDFANGIGLRWP